MNVSRKKVEPSMHVLIETFDWRASALREALAAAESVLPTIRATMHTTQVAAEAAVAESRVPLRSALVQSAPDDARPALNARAAAISRRRRAPSDDR